MKNCSVSIYVYIEYNDSDAFGERLVEVFQNKNDALVRLKNRVEENYNCSFENIPTELGLSYDDTFSSDYVSICDGDSTCFWIVEEHEVK